MVRRASDWEMGGIGEMGRWGYLDGAPLGGLVDEINEFAENAIVVFVEVLSCCLRHVSTFDCEGYPSLGFSSFCLAIRQLRNKSSLISSLTPSLSQICTDRARRPAHLICQRVALLHRKTLGQLKNLHCPTKRQLIDLQILMSPNKSSFHHP